jgi:uncharacterized membrane protein
MALGGAFWGFLFGLIFFAPFLGAAIAAGTTALLWNSLENEGIDEEFMSPALPWVYPYSVAWS